MLSLCLLRLLKLRFQLFHSPDQTFSVLEATRHPRSTVQPNHTPVQHDILNDMPRQRSKLGRRPAPLRELHSLLEAGPDLVAKHAGHGRLEGSRRDGDDADAVPRQVPRHGEGHGRHGALGGRVRHLAHLPVEGGGGRDHDHHAVLLVARGGDGGRGLRQLREELAHEVDGPAQVDAEDEV